MTSAVNQDTIALELDKAHAQAKDRYRAKDLGGFMRMYAPGLRYKQPDGKTIGWEQLAHDVSAQFDALEAAETQYVRESLQIDGAGATEILQQEASLTMWS